MTTSARSFRVGIVISGELVEEQVFPIGTAVTFGQSTRCALSVPVEGLPREHVLFGSDGALHPPAGAEVVGSTARGTLTLGDVTLLFQDVATPRPAPKMQLPASLRQSLADRVDRRLAAIVGGSIIVHVAIAGYAWMNDIAEPETEARYIAPLYEEQVIDLTAMPDFVQPPTTPGPGATSPVSPSQTSRPIVRQVQVQQPSVDPTRLASVLTGGESEVGKGGMASRQQAATLAQQIADAQDTRAKIGDGPTSRVDDRARVTDTDRAIANDPTLTQAPRPTHEERTGRVIPGTVKPESKTTLSPVVVLERISSLYMAGLQRCYRLGLAIDSTLAGKVAISFTVDERGKVIEADASGVSPQVDGCISRQMGTWRFPAPKDAEGSGTDASFTVSLALQPS